MAGASRRHWHMAKVGKLRLQVETNQTSPGNITPTVTESESEFTPLSSLPVRASEVKLAVTAVLLLVP